MNLDQVMKACRGNEPRPEEIEQAAARVKARLFPKAETAAPTATTIRGCADFTSLIPAHLTASLDPGRKLLLEVHTRECVGCRKALEAARHGGGQVVEMRQRPARNNHYAGWAIAASALLVAGGASYWGFQEYPAIGGGPRATVDSVEGALYKVSGASLTPLAPGAELGENDAVRTAKNSTAFLRLNDGSRIELNQRAQISVTRTWSGSTIHLGLGSIIVQAAKQRRGTLQVSTADCNVSVKGTVFSVDAGTKGSRVAVVEGTVWVDHGQKHDVLKRGDVTATASDMGPVPIRQEFEWSRNSSEYLALLGEFSELKRQIAAIPPPGLRYQSDLMRYLPADVLALAAIPNVGGTISQASQIFHDRLKQSETLAAWWNRVPAVKRNDLELVIRQLETATQYLGNEIVIALVPDVGRTSSPVILAQLTRAGFDSYLKSQLPPNVFDGHMRFDSGIFAAASNPADLNRIGARGDFINSPLLAKINPVYQRGAEWLFAADLASVPQAGAALNARYLVAESRTAGGITENRASVTFSKEREGVASWLTAPGPMGSLDFISPDAGFSATMLLKNPVLIVDDLTGMMSKASGQTAGLDLKNDLAGAFGGEVTIALDGPVLPAPSWKIAAEIYYPDRLQSSLSRLVTAFNSEGDHARTGELKLTQTDMDGRIFYRLQFEKLPWEADWTFVDGYWLAAANRELLVRSIQNRQTGYTLPKSNAFQSQLPHDGSSNFSAVVYHNLGPALAPIFGLLGNVPNLPKLDAKSGVICFWAAPDRIDVATMGSVLGMNIESLLAMQGAGPLQMMRQALK